ncbi:MAG: 50S ribosomal protein L19 [Candidatus Kuenenbacteria bacterium]
MNNQITQKQEEIIKEEKIDERIIPDIKPGMTVKVHQKIKEMGAKGERERIQVFEGIVLARKHGKEKGATVTVRKISFDVAVEKIFPLDLPTIVKIEIVNQAKVRRAKLYFLRDYKKKLKTVKEK